MRSGCDADLARAFLTYCIWLSYLFIRVCCYRVKLALLAIQSPRVLSGRTENGLTQESVCAFSHALIKISVLTPQWGWLLLIND